MSTDKDMAICLVFFNPVKSKRILMNYFYAKSLHEREGFPVFTMELVYEGESPEIPDAFHVKSKSIMFHKENLYRLLVQKIPRHYTKLAFLDSDVYFKSSSWYQETSTLLDTHTIVQPFETATWLDLTYTKNITVKKTILLMDPRQWSLAYHPGFAWCIQRHWYESKGFFDYAVSGGGDTLSVAAWLHLDLPNRKPMVAKLLMSSYDDYKKTIQDISVTFLQGSEIFHLFHGSLQNRQYVTRHRMLNVEGEIKTLTFTNEEGVLEWREPSKWNYLFRDYFQKRNDDELYTDPPKLDELLSTTNTNSTSRTSNQESPN